MCHMDGERWLVDRSGHILVSLVIRFNEFQIAQVWKRLSCSEWIWYSTVASIHYITSIWFVHSPLYIIGVSFNKFYYPFPLHRASGVFAFLFVCDIIIRMQLNKVFQRLLLKFLDGFVFCQDDFATVMQICLGKKSGKTPGHSITRFLVTWRGGIFICYFI